MLGSKTLVVPASAGLSGLLCVARTVTSLSGVVKPDPSTTETYEPTAGVYEPMAGVGEGVDGAGMGEGGAGADQPMGKGGAMP